MISTTLHMKIGPPKRTFIYYYCALLFSAVCDRISHTTRWMSTTRGTLDTDGPAGHGGGPEILSQDTSPLLPPPTLFPFQLLTRSNVYFRVLYSPLISKRKADGDDADRGGKMVFTEGSLHLSLCFSSRLPLLCRL